MWRLQKIMAHAGLASRRKSEELILQGRVTVNGRVVDRLGTRADPVRDEVRIDGVLLRPERNEYYIVNKPRRVLSAVSDPRGRPVVTKLVPSRVRLVPAGRLDFQSEGLMLLTNDGDLVRTITRAGNLEKVYHVKVARPPSPSALRRLQGGIRSGGKRMAARRIRLLEPGRNPWYEVVLVQGRNRQIRTMFEAVGHRVMKLRRVAIGPLRLGRLTPGQYRELADWEVRRLRRGNRKAVRKGAGALRSKLDRRRAVSRR